VPPAQLHRLRAVTRQKLEAELAHGFGISRQAIAKHIKVLNECGMLSITQKGREQFCEARLNQLDEVIDWATDSRKLWKQRFKKLDKFLDNEK